jgi:glycosyltransferase involved in cell wall biosynthesis
MKYSVLTKLIKYYNSYMPHKSQAVDFDKFGFDPVFYREIYHDLYHLDDPLALYKHYESHGAKEGRFPNRRAMISDLESKYGKLPDDFDPKKYVSLYPDLQNLRFTDRQAAEHYLRYGREEGRSYHLVNGDIYRELYLGGQLISDRDLSNMLQDVELIKGKLITGADIMKSKGIDGGGRWIEKIKIDEFALLNFGWAGPIETRMEAVDAMLSMGIERLAPLSLLLDFDVEFYRELEPSLAEKGDPDCYRHWLFRGFEEGRPGSPRQFFDELDLQLEAFPDSFQWRSYLLSARDLPRESNRWSALRHFVLTGFSRDDQFVKGKGAATFYKALGARFRRNNVDLSVDALKLAQRLEALDDTSLQYLADGYFHLGQWDSALATYEATIHGAAPAPTCFWNAARAAVRLGKFEHAFGVLREGKSICAANSEWRKALRETIQAEFDEAMSKARDLLKYRHRQSADELLTEAVARTARRYAELDPVGVPLPQAENSKVVILANVDSPQCTHYRVEQKQQLFETMGRDYQIFAMSEVDDFISALPGASDAIFYRLPAFPSTVRAIEVARALGIKTFYEIDDLIFNSKEYPEPFETYGSPTRGFYERLQLGVPLFRAAMSLCDYGISSTTSLAAHMRSIVRKGEVFVLPNGLDRLTLPFLASPPKRMRRDDSIVIFYGSGTQAHNSDFMNLAAPALLKILTEDRRVKLMILGYLTLDSSFDPVRNQIITIGWTDLYSYWSLLAEADIVIAVLASYATTDAKSELKWLEATAMSIPCIVSGTARYREVLEDNTDVLIADDPAEWETSLRRLIADPNLRKHIVTCAQKKLSTNYSLEANAAILSSILTSPKEKILVTKKNRILLVNVYFHPQSLGGSPRVVKDNLDCFLDGAAHNDFEFAVATADYGGEGLDQLRVENYRDCPVFRISPISTVNLDWQPDVPQTGLIFAEVLKVWRPDLVHFNCVQKLSGSAVEKCIEADIPYIVTVHDAWWIADWYFLTDSKDRLRDPTDWLPFDPPEPISVGAAMERRRLLTPLLLNAQAVLGVSASFTKLHQSCGFSEVVAVPNGVPRMKKAARTRSETGRVRVTHVGGQSKFKGFSLIQTVFKQHHFANIELTIVDVSRIGGSEYSYTWGATPVRVVGKTLSENMHEYYARYDVLLAPSLWPEAYGLVTREALAAGLWVVASDRGGISEDVAPGVNGWIIDVSTPQGLIDAISQIDSDPEKYLSSPPPTHLRTSQDQAEDILSIYRKVLTNPRIPERPYARKTVNREILEPTKSFLTRKSPIWGDLNV